MSKNDIYNKLSLGTAFDPHGIGLWDLWKGSSGFEAPFDYSAKDFLLDRQNYLFITDDGTNIVAHNYRNFGNFLWGASTYLLGIPEWIAVTGAHWNNYKTDNGWDSPDDQYSILLGRYYARKMGWETNYGGRGNIFKN